MNKFYIFKILGVITVALLCHLEAKAQGAIDVDFRNSVVSANQICFDVYVSAGTGYDGANQSGGEWISMTLSFDLDLVITSGTPVLGTGVIITNKNTSILDNTPGSVTGANSFIGNPPAGYEREYRLNLQNLSQNMLPATPTLAFNACIPVTGGTVAADENSDLRIRPTGTSGGALWSNGALNAQTIEPTDAMEPLPIELLTFEVRTDRCDSYLYWETATERNLSYYQIEASKDGQVFKAIGQHKPQSPNTAEKRAYKYPLPQAYQGYYLRLKAVDLDEAYEYSPVAYAEAPCEKNYDMQLYPNPSYVSELTVEISSPQAHEQVRWVLMDSFSKQIQQGKTDLKAGLNKLQIPTENLPSGTYYIQVLGVDALSVPRKFIRSAF